MTVARILARTEEAATTKWAVTPAIASRDTKESTVKSVSQISWTNKSARYSGWMNVFCQNMGRGRTPTCFVIVKCFFFGERKLLSTLKTFFHSYFFQSTAFFLLILCDFQTPTSAKTILAKMAGSASIRSTASHATALVQDMKGTYVKQVSQLPCCPFLPLCVLFQQAQKQK